MKFNRMVVGGPALILAASLAGCNSDSGVTGNVTQGQGLTQSEASSVSEEVALAALESLDAGLGSVFSGAAAGVSPAPQFGAAADRITIEFTHERDCPGGGLLTVSGTLTGEFDRATRSGQASLNATIAAAECVVMHGETAVTINTTDPHITKVGEFTIEEGRKSGTIDIDGMFTWATEGGSGECTIDVTITLTPEGRSKSGTVCGFAIDDHGNGGGDREGDNHHEGDQGGDDGHDQGDGHGDGGGGGEGGFQG